MEWVKTVLRPGQTRLRPDGWAVDVGANAGTYTQAFLESGAERVMAIEPHREMAQHLRDTYPGVTVIQAAASDRDGEAPFFYSALSEHGSLWRANLLEDIERVELVPTVTLDRVCPTADVIKLDAQGAEAAILRGATRLLAERRPVWYLELWPTGLQHAGSSLAEVRAIFEQHRYRPAVTTWAAIEADASRCRTHGSLDALVIPQEHAL